MTTRRCCVEGCQVIRSSQRDQHREWSLFSFPINNAERLRKFLDFANLRNLPTSSGGYVNLKKLCDSYKICERHFEKRFVCRNQKSKKLIITAVPTLNPPPHGIIPDLPVSHCANLHHSQPPSSDSLHALLENSEVVGTDVPGNVGSVLHGCGTEYGKEGTNEVDNETSIPTETASQISSGILHECENSTDVNGLQYHAETKPCPRRYENQRKGVEPNGRKKVVKYDNESIDLDAISVQVDSCHHAKPSSDFEGVMRAIDLPSSAIADNHCISMDSDDCSLQEALSPASDSDSSDSVVVIYVSKNGPTDPISSALTHEVEPNKCNTELTPLIPGVEACTVEVELAAVMPTAANTHELRDNVSHFSKNIGPEPTTLLDPTINDPVSDRHPGIPRQVINPRNTKVTEALNTDTAFHASNGIQNGTKPKRDFSRKPKQKARISTRQSPSRVFLTPRNILLWHRLNASENRCKKLSRQLEKARRTIMLLKRPSGANVANYC